VADIVRKMYKCMPSCADFLNYIATKGLRGDVEDVELTCCSDLLPVIDQSFPGIAYGVAMEACLRALDIEVKGGIR